MKQLGMFAILLAAASALSAQTVGLTAPVSGVVFDARTHSIRTLTGYPGASMLGGTVAGGIDYAEISPDGGLALVVKEGGLHLVAGLKDGALRWNRLAVEGADIDLMAWSRDSLAAAIYSSSARMLAVASNLSAPSMDLQFLDVTGLEKVRAVAVSGNGRLAVAVAEGGVYLMRNGAPPLLAAPMDNALAVQMARGDRDVFVINGRHIVKVQDIAGNAEPIPFITLDAGSRASALGLTPDDRLLLAADPACRCVPVFDIPARQTLDTVALEIEPAFLKPLAGGRQFLLNAPSTREPLWLLSTGDVPAAYFVSGGVE